MALGQSASKLLAAGMLPFGCPKFNHVHSQANNIAPAKKEYHQLVALHNGLEAECISDRCFLPYG